MHFWVQLNLIVSWSLPPLPISCWCSGSGCWTGNTVLLPGSVRPVRCCWSYQPLPPTTTTVLTTTVSCMSLMMEVELSVALQLLYIRGLKMQLWGAPVVRVCGSEVSLPTQTTWWGLCGAVCTVGWSILQSSSLGQWWRGLRSWMLSCSQWPVFSHSSPSPYPSESRWCGRGWWCLCERTEGSQMSLAGMSRWSPLPVSQSTSSPVMAASW